MRAKLKNIVLLSDGSGNSTGKLAKTNVWRLYQALDLSKPDDQISSYDDGVGTSSFKSAYLNRRRRWLWTQAQRPQTLHVPPS
jgi:uncharacterized protein (DUF2235 family)